MNKTFSRLIGLVVLLLPTLALAADPVKTETQSVFFDWKSQEMSSSAVIKLLNDKLDGSYQDLELIVSACFSGEIAARASGPKPLKGTWSVSTATDKEHTISSAAGEIPGAGNFKFDGGTFNGWLPAWISKVKADGNSIGNKALAEYAEAEHLKAFEGNDPQYSSSGATADTMTVHGGAESNHAILFQMTGFKKVVDAMASALKGAGYTDAELTVITAGQDGTWANFEKALGDLRKKLDAHPNREKVFIDLLTHGSVEERTVAYAPGKFGTEGGGAILTSVDFKLPIRIDDPVVLATVGESLFTPSGGFFYDDPYLHRFGPAVIRLSTLDQYFVNSTSVGIFVNNINIGALDFGSRSSGDYQIPVPDSVLSSVFGNATATGLLEIGFKFSSPNDWFRLATLEDWRTDNYANLDYGIGIAANVGTPDGDVPESGNTCLMFGLAFALILVFRRSRSAFND